MTGWAALRKLLLPCSSTHSPRFKAPVALGQQKYEKHSFFPSITKNRMCMRERDCFGNGLFNFIDGLQKFCMPCWHWNLEQKNKFLGSHDLDIVYRKCLKN